jgi:hypothetical protein
LREILCKVQNDLADMEKGDMASFGCMLNISHGKLLV